MNKFDRVISILIQLQSKKIIKATTLAERFDISLRTIYRDIATLKKAGVPIIGDPGIGYSIMDGYRLPPIAFNEGEAAALLTAEKFIGNMTDKDTQKYYSSAMMKIKAILRSSEKQSVAILEESIAITDFNSIENKAYLQDIFKSIASKRVLSIQYKKADESRSNRQLEAVGCYHHAKNWYLVAFCRLKKAYRTFKINRIIDLRILDEHFDAKHIGLQNYIDQQKDSWKEENHLHSMEIAFNHSLVRFADRRKYYLGFVDQTVEAEVIRMKFLNSSIELMARWLLQFGDQATVVAPEELKDRLKELVAQLHRHYQA